MGLIRKSGGYRLLRSFRAATVIYDATYHFVARFVDPHSRTVDQMVQAARSGRQNIAEGSRAGATSSQTELRLVNVARSSLDELLLDYEDFLRHRGYEQWNMNHPEAEKVRHVARTLPHYEWADKKERHPVDLFIRIPREDYSAYAIWLNGDNPQVIANAMICLINQANTLLDTQIEALERDFVEEGGYSESLAAARLAYRSQQQGTTANSETPVCPDCGSLMVLRTAHKGAHEGEQFWGCSKYPTCKGVCTV